MVYLNYNFKENFVRGRYCDGVCDGFFVVVVFRDVFFVICCGLNFF